jgi:hypothetical protein
MDAKLMATSKRRSIMKVLTVNMHSATGQAQPLIYKDVTDWTWDDKALKITLDDDTLVQLNPTYVIGVVWREELEPEQPELWDVDEDESETDD